METRANHVLIGAFVLVFMAGLSAFVLWLAKAQIDTTYAYYDIFFTGSVAGLGQGGDVRFNGIKVGAVERIRIDPENPQQVQVTVGVDPAVPVRADSVAQLQPQGITGVVFVQIDAGTRQAPLLSQDGDRLPVIQSRPSAIDALFQNVPDLMARVSLLTDRATELLTPDNQRNIAGVLADLKQVSGAIAGRQEQIAAAIDNAAQITADLGETARAARQVAERLDKVGAKVEGTLTGLDRTIASASGTLRKVDTLVDRDVAPFLADLRRTSAALSELAVQLQGAVAENRGPVRDFTGEGLQDFRLFVNEARVLVSRLARVAQRLEDDPSQVLFGARDAEYTPRGGR